MTLHALGQSTEDAKLLLDAVASKMEGYENMEIKFSQTLVNEDAGIYDGDEAPIVGKIILQQEKYNLEYLGNTFLFNGFTMYVGYTYTMGKVIQKNGRNLQFVNLFPMDNTSNIIKVELVIDLKTKHIYQLIQTGENGSKTTFTITTFIPNQKLPEKIFSFDTQKYSEENGYTID